MWLHISNLVKMAGISTNSEYTSHAHSGCFCLRHGWWCTLMRTAMRVRCRGTMAPQQQDTMQMRLLVKPSVWQSPIATTTCTGPIPWQLRSNTSVPCFPLAALRMPMTMAMVVTFGGSLRPCSGSIHCGKVICCIGQPCVPCPALPTGGGHSTEIVPCKSCTHFERSQS